MALAAIQVTVELTHINCGECGGVYALNERFRKQCADHGKSWTCPYCKTGWGYTGNGALQKAERELEAERQRRHDALTRLNEAEARERKVLRKLKRVERGVCPDCNRTFANLARHMACKHAAPAA